ncbi:sterol desaturase family protein [Sphingomonas sp.]|uniref:sterol desaturase family protein n=1 Tax=Sphingomonas sp. TaxID=28214 RepID=UPI001B0EF873|nr:sterol desaturase family protein [Sphingomonas sp.]MBO9714646.1 sterol desaturase family protein [Sphingomonas sp.]
MTLLLWIAARWTRPRRIQSRTPEWEQKRREFGNSLVTVGIFAVNGIGIFAGARAGIFHVSDALPAWWLGLLEFAAIVLAHDAYFYWMHRGLHARAMFRIAHLEHHKSRTPTPWAAYSFAPLEGGFEAMFMPIFLLFVPMHAVVVIAFVLHQISRNVLGHMGHELAWPGFTRSRWTGWLTTTTHHDLHHSQGRYNFGLYFTWWDRWMGTEHPLYHDAFETAAQPWFGRRKDAIA